MTKREAEMYPAWTKAVQAGEILVSFNEWMRTENHRRAKFDRAFIGGSNCSRALVEKLMAQDNLIELINGDGVRVFVPWDDFMRVQRILAAGVGAIFHPSQQ